MHAIYMPAYVPGKGSWGGGRAKRCIQSRLRPPLLLPLRAVRPQSRQVFSVFAVLVLTLIFLLLVRMYSCWTFVFVW